MSHLIQSVDSGSPAERAGFREGDRLVRIDGEIIIDLLDYQALTASRRFSAEILRNGQPLTLNVRKSEYASLGLNFDMPMMSGVRMCCNHCLFCFVDQLPPNVRPTMRVKDDDWRMSLMMGNYVTLTNMPDRGIERVIRRHASPLYISVHATEPELRARILGTPRAASLMRQLQALSNGGIDFHCQAVLCPGLNDCEALERTISDLITLRGARSLALVPVGLTEHREGLCPLHPYTKEEARAVIAIADRWREKLLEEHGTRFVFPSDEFYLLADLPVPPDETYEGYEQIDDGVGLLRLLRTEYEDAWNDLPESDRQNSQSGKHVLIATGCSAAPFIRQILEDMPITGVCPTVLPIENCFFGKTVTVAGLVTGSDLTLQINSADFDCILITETMLRSEGDAFLDDTPLETVRNALGKPLLTVGRRGDELLQTLLQCKTMEV